MQKETIQPNAPGQKPITFNKGGLHVTTNTPVGQKIPASKIAAALAGQYGPKGKQQALFMKNVLKG
jgi:hypothetical protein